MAKHPRLPTTIRNAQSRSGSMANSGRAPGGGVGVRQRLRSSACGRACASRRIRCSSMPVPGRKGDRASTSYLTRAIPTHSGAVRHARRQWRVTGDGMRAADGHARRQAHAVPGSAIPSAATVVVIAEWKVAGPRRSPPRLTVHTGCPDVRTQAQQRTANSILSPSRIQATGRVPTSADARPAQLHVATCNRTSSSSAAARSGRRPATTIASAGSPRQRCRRCAARRASSRGRTSA